ncbi:MAG: hypothetical protein JSU04_09375 [Bdellovibrionales bacterium]|nr:hypothetical protein [Bdellovibrionales bacterium]
MKTTCLFFLLMLFQSFSFGSTTDFGNGGNIILCTMKNELAQATFYDVYESEVRYSLPVQFPRAGACQLNADGTYSENCKIAAQKMASNIASRLKKIDAAFEATIQSYIRDFWADTGLVNADLFPIADTGLGFIPQNCSLKQLAIQHVPRNKNDKRYYVATNLLRLLDVQNQAAMILHEVFYHWALTQSPGIQYSERVRYFNALVLSGRVTQLSYPEYVQEKAQLVSSD